MPCGSTAPLRRDSDVRRIGFADKIAERLFVFSHTVRTEVKAIYRKLGVSSRNDAVQRRQRSACSSASRRA